MKVVGYSYDADTHCVDCTRKYILEFFPETAPVIDSLMSGEQEFSDYNIEDSEGNQLHPIFDISEAGDSPDHCGNCGEFIDNSWSGDTVDYVVERLRDYIESGGKDGNSVVLDIWADNLGWCICDDNDDIVRNYYRMMRRGH